MIKLLDHGFVRLVDYMGSDLSIVRAARVSYDAAWRTGDDTGSDRRLLRRLIKDEHTSPLEAVEFQFEIKAPIFVFRQWHRHRTWAYNELSARYRELPEEYYLPDPAIVGVQSVANKQGRTLDPDMVHRRLAQINVLSLTAKESFRVYKLLLQEGWPRELARGVLPFNTYSHMFAKVDLLNLFRFLHSRLDPHAQYEIRVYAEALLELARDVAPEAVEAWMENRARIAQDKADLAAWRSFAPSILSLLDPGRDKAIYEAIYNLNRGDF